MKLSPKITNTISSVNQWLVDHPMASIVIVLVVTLAFGFLLGKIL